MGNNASRDNKHKVDMSLIPYVANAEECKVWMEGAKKYPPDENGKANWKKLWGDKTPQVVGSSLVRHALKMVNGEMFDKETGLPHAAHIRCNAAMILEWMANEGLIDSETTSKILPYGGPDEEGADYFGSHEQEYEKKIRITPSDEGKIVRLRNGKLQEIVKVFTDSFSFPVYLNNGHSTMLDGRAWTAQISEEDIVAVVL